MSNKDNNQPMYILPEDSTRETGTTAQRNNILAAKLVGETIRTTLGPKGMDKMLVDSLGDVIVTNDGVTILKEMQIEHPAAKMLVEIAKTQETEVGDGTTTAVILAAELLKKAEKLLDKKVHPTIIVKGYRLAAKKAISILNDKARTIDVEDSDTLLKIASTAMTGKGAESSKELLSKIVVKAVKKIAKVEDGITSIDTEDIILENIVGESVDDTKLIEGIIIDKEIVHSEMPKKLKNPKILLLNSAIELRDNEIDTKIQINDPSKMQEFLQFEENMIRDIAKKIIDTGANIVLCQKGIDELAQHLLAKNGITAIRRVKKSDLEKVSKATGAKIVTSIDSAEKNDLGECGFFEEKKIGEEKKLLLGDCKGSSNFTVLIRGNTEHVVDEVKRALEDSIGVVASALKSKKVVSGAGAIETQLLLELKSYADTLSGREQLAVDAFAQSLEIIPVTLAQNAGLDPIDVLTDMKSNHKNERNDSGIDVFTGKIMDSWKEGVIEPLKIKTQAISSASEVAIMILRIDDVIASGVNPQPPQGGMGPEGMM